MLTEPVEQQCTSIVENSTGAYQTISRGRIPWLTGTPPSAH